MNTPIKIPWLKIIGWGVLIHIILIAISFLEVFLYATFIHPGKENAFYEAHAEITAPYVSYIFGFILFFFVVRKLCKIRREKWLPIAIALPVIYTLLDFLMLQAASVNWGEHYLLFVFSFFIKSLGGFLGAYSLKNK